MVSAKGCRICSVAIWPLMVWVCLDTFGVQSSEPLCFTLMEWCFQVGHILQPWFLMISRSFHSFPMFGHVPPTGTILKHIAAQVERKGHTKQRNMQICCECAGCSDLITQRAKNKTKHLNTLCWISSSLFLQPTSTVWIMSQKANFRLCFPAQSPKASPKIYRPPAGWRL
jgi:hypothetical protein